MENTLTAKQTEILEQVRAAGVKAGAKTLSEKVIADGGHVKVYLIVEDPKTGNTMSLTVDHAGRIGRNAINY